MKPLLLVCALLISSPLLAERSISLKPGSSVVVDGTVVNCTGSADENLKECTVTAFYDGVSHEVRVGGLVWGRVQGLDNAVKIVLQLKEAGICR